MVTHSQTGKSFGHLASAKHPGNTHLASAEMPHTDINQVSIMKGPSCFSLPACQESTVEFDSSLVMFRSFGFFGLENPISIQYLRPTSSRHAGQRRIKRGDHYKTSRTGIRDSKSCIQVTISDQNPLSNGFIPLLSPFHSRKPRNASIPP